MRYGPHAGSDWEGSRPSPAGTTHAVELTGLRPDTRYFYRVESGGSVLAGGTDHTFRTSPPQNARTPLRFGAGELLALELRPEGVGSDGRPQHGLYVRKELDATTPAVETRCAKCGTLIEGWSRFCPTCNSDLSGVARITDQRGGEWSALARRDPDLQQVQRLLGPGTARHQDAEQEQGD